MKKRITMLALILVLTTPAVFSWGVGAAFSIDAMGDGLPQSAMLSVHAPGKPFIVGAGMKLGQEEFNLAFTADWWMIDQNLTGIVDYYIGPGFYVSAPDTLELGGRVPIGFQVFPISGMELFLELAPTVLFFSSNEGIEIPKFGLQSAFGLRFWF